MYLGDWHHASDAHVIETLGITHILNISDSCENYLAESHRKFIDHSEQIVTFVFLFNLAYLRYLHLCLHDEKEQDLLHVFQEIFEFIKEATIPGSQDIDENRRGENG